MQPHENKQLKENIGKVGELGQDGRAGGCGVHLPPQYIRNASTNGMTLKEHLLNTGRRTQTPKRTRGIYLCNCVR